MPVVGLLANSIPVSELTSGKITNPAPKIIDDGLRGLGWIDGKNIRLVWRTVEGNYARWPEVVDEFIGMKVDVLVVFTTDAAKIAIERTRTIPVVNAGAGPMLDPKIVDSLQRPGVNLAGMSTDGLNLGAKRMELLKAAAPTISRLAVLAHSAPLPPNTPFLSPQAEAVRKSQRLEVLLVTFRDLGELPAAFSEIVAKRANGLLVSESPHMHYREYQLPIHEFSISHRIPAMYAVLNSVDSGGLMSYSLDILDFYRSAPRYIDKILRGAKAGEIPIESPTKFQFVINLKTARAMGLTIPSLVLSLADRVIE